MSTDPSGGEGRGTVRPSLLDELHVGILVLDTQGRIVLWGVTTEEILGWSGSEAVGRRLADFLPPEHEDHGLQPGTDVYHTLLREHRWRGRLPLRHRNGSTVELEGRASLARHPDGTRYILANLVETHRMARVEQDLAALDSVFTASPLGLALFDTELRHTRVNDALLSIHGGPSESLLGKTVRESLPASFAEQVQAVQSEVLRTGRPVVDLVTASPDERGALSLSFARLADNTGHVLGISGTVMDITERRKDLWRVERARQRLALLDDVGSVLGDLLDVRRIADSLTRLLVPRLADYSAVLLHTALARSEGGTDGKEAFLRSGDGLVRVAVAAKSHDPDVDVLLRPEEERTFQEDSLFARTFASGVPRLFRSAQEILVAAGTEERLRQFVSGLGLHSLIAMPLRARGIPLGLLLVARSGQRAPFDDEDHGIASEVGARAAMCLDNARLYARERRDALMLQRSLLPQSLPRPHGVHLSYRYVPSSGGPEVGGDWFDVLPLPGGRVAFVVGDVTGHGLRAAATMGRLRTAVRTLAALGLSPAELLRRVNELSPDLASGPDEPLMATCLYAVFDPAVRSCCFSQAGHMPPVLLGQEADTGLWSAQPLHMPPGVPLGVGDAAFEERTLTVPEGTVLVLYTDGLIEFRGEDITDGLDRLCDLLARTAASEGTSLENLCDRTISGMGHPRSAVGLSGPDDDIALLTVQLGELPVRGGFGHGAG